MGCFYVSTRFASTVSANRKYTHVQYGFNWSRKQKKKAQKNVEKRKDEKTKYSPIRGID